jgi:hypothetical protein
LRHIWHTGIQIIDIDIDIQNSISIELIQDDYDGLPSVNIMSFIKVGG